MKKAVTEIFEEICGKLSRPTRFIVAGMDEANILVDKSSFPVMILLPPTIVDKESMTGVVDVEFPFDAMLLDRFKQDTRDFSYNEVMKEIVEPMTDLGREFINAVKHYRHEDNSKLVNELLGIGDRNFRPAFDETDATLHGVQMTCTMNLWVDITSC